MIDNPLLSSNQLHALNFCLQKLDKYRDVLEKQIESSIIVEDSSPYYCILRFNNTGKHLPLISDNLRFDVTIQVLHKRKKIPSVFIFYIKEGLLREFEFFNADSSEINVYEMCDDIAEIVFELF